MLVALDEGPGPAIKYQYAELGRLYQVVSQLIRSCDVSFKQQSSQTVIFIDYIALCVNDINFNTFVIVEFCRIRLK